MNILVALSIIFISKSALAYIGPGLGLGLIASMVGLIFSILLFVLAIIWFPLKRLIKKNKLNKNDKDKK